MSVWLCIPSARPQEQAELVLRKWRERGYSIALWRDHFDISTYQYPGYAAAVNALVRSVLNGVPDAEWFICAGDDTEPDANYSAAEIAAQCADHFAYHNSEVHQMPHSTWKAKGLFGVMQPTGDRYGINERHIGQPGTAYIDRVCGSPWMGREFCRRMYGGHGPLCEEYFHMGEDEELQCVAQKLGVLWQRPDLIHFHRHWARKNKDRADMPKFLERANSTEEWQKYKRIFAARQAAGFPGHEPLEA